MMEYKIEKLSDIEVLKIKVLGTLGHDTRKNVHLKTLSEIDKSGYHKLLIDLSASKMPLNYTMVNSLDLISFLDKIEKNKHIKIAFLSRYKEKNQEKFMKLSMAITQRWIKLFTEYDEGINWLIES